MYQAGMIYDLPLHLQQDCHRKLSSGTTKCLPLLQSLLLVDSSLLAASINQMLDLEALRSPQEDLNQSNLWDIGPEASLVMNQL